MPVDLSGDLLFILLLRLQYGDVYLLRNACHQWTMQDFILPPYCLLLILKAIPEGFSVDVYPSENPLEQEKVSLCCSADNYTYDQLEWYRLNPQALQDQQGKPQELDCRNVHNYATLLQGQPSFQEHSNSWVLDFTIESTRLQDEGYYVCKAQSRRSREKQCLFRYISVKGEEKRHDTLHGK